MKYVLKPKKDWPKYPEHSKDMLLEISEPGDEINGMRTISGSDVMKGPYAEATAYWRKQLVSGVKLTASGELTLLYGGYEYAWNRQITNEPEMLVMLFHVSQKKWMNKDRCMVLLAKCLNHLRYGTEQLPYLGIVFSNRK